MFLHSSACLWPPPHQWPWRVDHGNFFQFFLVCLESCSCHICVMLLCSRRRSDWNIWISRSDGFTVHYFEWQGPSFTSVKSWLLKIIGFFCKRAVQKRRYSAKETCDFYFEWQGPSFTSVKTFLKFWGLPWKPVWKLRGLPWKLVWSFGSRKYLKSDLLRPWIWKRLWGGYD